MLWDLWSQTPRACLQLLQLHLEKNGNDVTTAQGPKHKGMEILDTGEEE